MCDILRAHLGVQLEAFGHGPDGGVDLRSKTESEYMVVQCKHYRGSSFSDLIRSARKEKAKMDRERPTVYLFVTSQDLSITQKDQLVETLRPHVKLPKDVLGLRDLNQLIADYPQIEENHFKLWMASAAVIRRIVSSGLWERSEGLMEEIQDRVRLYVSTASYSTAIETLRSKNVCVLTGAPGVGKSMLADMIALTYWESGWQIVPLGSHEIDDSWNVWNSEQKQLFYFDDVFGQTDIQERLSRDSGTTLSRLIRRIGNAPKKLLVITTRTHVLRDAELRDEPVQRAGLRARECVVQVQDYSRIHRARILYNHLYFSRLSKELVRSFVGERSYFRVIDHANFTPRLIEQTILMQEEGGGSKDLIGRMMRALDRPVLLWGPSFREALTDSARWILMHLASFPVQGAPFDELRAASIRGSTPIDYTRAVNQLEGSWIRIESSGRSDESNVVSFHDPSCRDFVLGFLDSEPDYVMQVLRFSTSAVQISQFLRYGRSTNPVQIGQDPRSATWKYEGVRSALLATSEQLSVLIKAAWEQPSKQQDKYALETLRAIDGSRRSFGLDLGTWIAECALRLGDKLEEPVSADSLACSALATELMKSGLTPKSAEEFESCSKLLQSWWMSISEAVEWDDSIDFSSWLESLPGYAEHSVESDSFFVSFSSWLDSELDVILDNASNADDASQWSDEARQLADKYFGQSRFVDVFYQFDHRVEEKWQEQEPDEDYEQEERAARVVSKTTRELLSQATSGGAPSPESKIAAMFDQLR